MELTDDLLSQLLPHASDGNIKKYLQPLNTAMREFQINTPMRICAFLAQIEIESGSLNYVQELASGEAYDTGAIAEALGNTPEKDGDGQKYKGHGLIQITGHDNHLACGTALGLDLINHPELLLIPINACRSAGWFWNTRGLNSYADVGLFATITKRINGGYTALAARNAAYTRNKKIFGLKV